MKKLLSIILSFVLILTLSACASSKRDNGADLPAEKPSLGEGVSDPDGDYSPSEEVFDAVLEEDAVGEIPVKKDDLPTGNGSPTAGTLTAGEWKDLDDLAFWRELLQNNDWYTQMENRDIFPNKISAVSVKDESGNPCFNAKTELLDSNGNVLYTAVTDMAGHAYLAYDLDNKGNTPTRVRVGDIEVPVSDGVTNVTLNGGRADVTMLDLMLTVDTTGSMGDELEYLKIELEDVIKQVYEASNGILSINVSVNFYRDNGDEYIVRPFEFTGEISDAIKNLKSQSSKGGGDYPEAVDAALESSVIGHQWRDGAVKLLFLVLDAPPHSGREIDDRLQSTVAASAQTGIRIIPVASSGVNTETEFLMRSFAVMTGGTYIFLTDHSGVGNSHLEPTVGEYQVEALNACLVRVIKEYCGLK